MDNLFGAAAIPTPDTPLLQNDEAQATEIRAADDTAAITAGLASYGAPPPFVLPAGKQPLHTLPPVVTLDVLNGMSPPAGGFTESSHVRAGPMRRVLRFLMRPRDV